MRRIVSGVYVRDCLLAENGWSLYWDMILSGSFPEVIAKRVKYIQRLIGTANTCPIAKKVSNELQQDFVVCWIHNQNPQRTVSWVPRDPVMALTRLANQKRFRRLAWLDPYRTPTLMVVTSVPNRRPVRLGYVLHGWAACFIITMMYVPRWLH